MVIVNLEQGMPTVQSALINLRQSILTSRARGIKAIKLIHGYGSSGKGGAIRTAVKRELISFKQAGKIKEFVPGEEFSPFYENARRAAELAPEILKDSDYFKTNHGITIVVL